MTITIGGDLTVGPIGYGAMRLTGPELWGEYPDRAGGIALLRDAVDAGLTLIDTADVYGPHTCEQLIRDALWPYPDGLMIATKGGFVRGGPALTSIDAVGNATYLRQSARLSARRLGLDRIDLYYLHSGYARDVPFEEQVGTLAELRADGLIRHIGLSNVTPDQLAAARRIVEIAAVTAHFNVGDRVETPLLDAAVEDGAVFVPWQPVSLTVPGAATDTRGPEHARQVLDPIAARHTATVSQVSLAWLLARAPGIMPCPGTTSTAHLRENLAAASLKLDATEIAAIDGIAPPDPASSSAGRDYRAV
ncbi:MAG TPA: aldo/keto reductase [Asanoa sp.]|nr:aldo/keto reductase [Asanoa sp.]